MGRSEAHLARHQEIQALKARYTRLTPREREVMALVVVGLLNKQVADELHISEITVKAHRGCMMRKMEAKSFAELVNMASRFVRNVRRRLCRTPDSWELGIMSQRVFCWWFAYRIRRELQAEDDKACEEFGWRSGNEGRL